MQSDWSNGGVSHLRPCCPLCIEASAIVKRFLRSHSSRRETCVQVGAANGFHLGHSLTEKNGEAADEGVARTGAVDALHHEWRNVLTTVTTGEKRSIGSESDDYAADPA